MTDGHDDWVWVSMLVGEYTRSLLAQRAEQDRLYAENNRRLLASITPDSLAGFRQAPPVAELPLAQQIVLYESGQATLDELSPAAAASARRRAEAGDETRKPRPADVDVAAEVRRMMRRIADARRIIITAPADEQRVRDHVDDMALAGFFDIVTSEHCPEGQMYLISRKALAPLRAFEPDGDAW
jgi:hypothetical protein